MISRYAAPSSFDAARYSFLSVTYQVIRVMCSGFAFASARISTIFFRACCACPTNSFETNFPSLSQPTVPLTKMILPLAATPLEKPLGRAHDGGCRIFMLCALPQDGSLRRLSLVLAKARSLETA